MILVSSCLAGQKVRYNGTDCLNGNIQRLLDENKVTMVCPELLGGFSIPRNQPRLLAEMVKMCSMGVQKSLVRQERTSQICI